MASRTERGRTGPISRADIDAIFDRGYSGASLRALLKHWSLSESDPDAFAAALEDPERARAFLEQCTEEQFVLLEALAERGGRARAENLRKELLLGGRGEHGESIRALVRRGVVIVVPGSGQAELELDALLEQQGFLQQEIALAAALEELVEGRIARGEVGVFHGEVTSSRVELSQALELNLLHLSVALIQNPLRLNKSGAPNRRSLAKFVEGLTRPALSNSPDPWFELGVSDSDDDYLAFLLALAAQLKLTRVRGHELVGSFDQAQKYFCASDEKRSMRRLDALKKLAGWSELVSAALINARQSEDVIDLQLSQHADNGAALIGARGYLLSVLRRAHLDGWTPVDAVVELCMQLDRDYLPRVLSKLGTHDLDIAEYVRAFISRALLWMGLVELGVADDETEVMRLSEQGEQLLGQADAPVQVATPGGCMIVQPNLEAMVFLDNAAMEVLFRMYQVSDRVGLANRVATFKLSARSVQRGYSQGLDAEGAISMLNAASHAPLASATEFQLRDWERVWGKMTLWARGTLIRHEDPDRLDSLLSELLHVWRGKDVQIERITAGAVFIDIDDVTELHRIVDRNDGVWIDYLGHIPPCLEFEEPLVLAYSPMFSDIGTIDELKKISAELKPRCTPRRRVVELQAEAILERWPEETFAHVVDFLRPRAIGGLPASHELKLHALLERPPVARIRESVTVLTLESAQIMEIFCRVEEVAPMILARLGDRAIAVAHDDLPSLRELLTRVGVRVGR